jgi:hypothetical protein
MIRMAIIKKRQIRTNVEEDMEKLEPSHISARSINWCSQWKTVWQVLKRLNIELPYDLQVLF